MLKTIYATKPTARIRAEMSNKPKSYIAAIVYDELCFITHKPIANRFYFAIQRLQRSNQQPTMQCGLIERTAMQITICRDAWHDHGSKGFIAHFRTNSCGHPLKSYKNKLC
jgi:hypothetical protein